MRRDDFFNEIRDMDDLYSFCCDNGLEDYMSDYSTTSRGGWFDDDIYETIRNWDDSWNSLYNYLGYMDDIADSYSWAMYDCGEWVGVDNGDYDRLRNEVYEAAVDNNCFDDDDGIETVEEVEQQELVIEDPVEEEDCSIFEVVESSRGTYDDVEQEICMDGSKTEANSNVAIEEAVDDEPLEVLFA